jgi:acyl dehydratase
MKPQARPDGAQSGWATLDLSPSDREDELADPYIEFELPIERGKVREFALAVGEDNPVFFDSAAARQQGLPDIVAPPTFTATQMWQVGREEREERLGTRLDYGRVLHGEQEFVYQRLPFAGEVLTGVMRVARDLTKEGKRGGALRFVTYESRFTDAQGEEVLTSYYTLIETARDPSS